MGGILAGPGILDCSADKNGFGSCLRERLSLSGLVPPEAERIDKPVLVSDTPVAVEPPRKIGWIEANAHEFGGMPSVSVTLTAPGGSMDAAGWLAGQGQIAGDAALTARGGKIEAGGDVASPSVPDVEVALAAPLGALSATGAGNAPVLPVELTLQPKAGVLGADGGEGLTPVLEANAAPVRGLGDLTITGGVGSDPVPGGTILVAPEPLAFDAPLIKAEIADAPPVIRFDPQYPNVLVLPTPDSGEDSSFRMLQLN